MKQSTKDILKAAAIIIFVPTAIIAVGWVGKKGFDFYTGKKADTNLKKILEGLKAGTEKISKSKKLTPTQKEVEDIQTKWSDELKKLSPSALSTFADWFLVTIPFGKAENGMWAYEAKGDKEGVEFNKKKDALYPKFADELKKTKIEDYFSAIEKSFFNDKTQTYYVFDK